MNKFKKAFCWSLLLHIIIIGFLILFFKSNTSDSIDSITVTLMESKVEAHSTNSSPQNKRNNYYRNSLKSTQGKISNNNPSLKQTIEDPDRREESETNNETNTNEEANTDNISNSLPTLPGPSTHTMISNREPRIKLIAPVEYKATQGSSLTFKILVGTDGKALRVEMDQGSGNSSLDEAVKNALKQSQYYPAVAEGEYKEGWFTFHYRDWSIGGESQLQPPQTP